MLIDERQKGSFHERIVRSSYCGSPGKASAERHVRGRDPVEKTSKLFFFWGGGTIDGRA